MADFVCPRCNRHVITPDGEDPRCGACDYPGPDARPVEAQHPEVLGDDRVLSGKAVAAMVLGITSVSVPVAGLATGITAIPMALRARHDITLSQGVLKGRGQANAGLALAVVGIAVQAALLSGTAATAWRRWRG